MHSEDDNVAFIARLRAGSLDQLADRLQDEWDNGFQVAAVGWSDLRAIADLPSPAVDREALIRIGAGAIMPAYGIATIKKATAVVDALLARYDIRERGETQAEPDGAALIAAERRRVIAEEGRTPEHDDQHVHGELLDAARCYANQGHTYFAEHTNAYGTDSYSMYDQNWPWWSGDEPAGWKPSSDPVRNLVKAGQFIAAEIDRLQRAKGGDQS